jgi:hypothetical protein
MAMKVSREEVWIAGIADRPGTLAKKLETLACAGAELEFVIARRSSKKPGGVVFVTPLKGDAQLAAAKKAGFRMSKSLNSIRIEGTDKPGLGAKITRCLADKGVNLRGLSAGVIGKRFVLHLALDSAKDANKAMRVLKGK